MRRVNINSIRTSKRYLRNGSDCIMDKAKHILRPVTPEEDVRQKTLEFMHDEMDIPFSAMDTEVPVSHFRKGIRGRMDIVVYGNADNRLFPLMLVECKAPNIPMTDDVYNQAMRYAEQVDIAILMVTNGNYADILVWNYEKQIYEESNDFPSYEELFTPVKIETKPIREYIYHRYSFDELFLDKNVNEELYAGEFIGEGSPKGNIPYIVNLAQAFRDNEHMVDSLYMGRYKFIKDGGLRYTSFGNASGGSYPGMYRFFIVNDENNNTQIVSIAVSGCQNGRSLLIVAIDDFDKHHNSLQLSLDHHSVIDGDYMLITHDGTMTVGNIGSVKKQKVLDFAFENGNFKKTDSGKIYLGKLRIDRLLYCDSEDMKELIANLIEYSLIRDELRKELMA